MDRRAHSKRSLLTQCGVALLCVLFCLLSGCQMAGQPAQTGSDPELAELAMSLSAGEPNTVGAASADKPAALASATGTRAEPAGKAAAANTPEPSNVPAPVKEAEPAAPVPNEGAATQAKKAEAAPVTATKVETPPAPVKKAESAAMAEQAVTAPEPVEQPAPTRPEAPAAGGGAEDVPAKTVPKEGEAAGPGPETIEGTTQPGAAEPKEEKKSEELTAIIIGGKEIIISEPLPMKTVGLAGNLKLPDVAMDTIPLAASNVAVDAPPAATATPAEGEGAAEGDGTKFKGLIGLGRSALGYAGEHYIALGSMALATPAVIIFARKRKVIRRAFRRMNLDD
ncbi:MAG TPA: hypothetical protein P5279_00925 [Anaerohalosphaeraceae bacterium]|jgi:hypothetical protein|nr:hypothetical protein [Anaerohalosphaeraceae bacterium]HRT49028.1 hypothetical protein [Anaerohalosphaeraceae bacterium]HRT85151.1 hypothetical protein [Anaerohalosphaeraceae bacterium]